MCENGHGFLKGTLDSRAASVSRYACLPLAFCSLTYYHTELSGWKWLCKLFCHESPNLGEYGFYAIVSTLEDLPRGQVLGWNTKEGNRGAPGRVFLFPEGQACIDSSVVLPFPTLLTLNGYPNAWVRESHLATVK